MAKKKMQNYTWLIIAAIIVIAIIVLTSGEGGTLAKFAAPSKITLPAKPAPVPAANESLECTITTSPCSAGYSCVAATGSMYEKVYSSKDGTCSGSQIDSGSETWIGGCNSQPAGSACAPRAKYGGYDVNYDRSGPYAICCRIV